MANAGEPIVIGDKLLYIGTDNRGLTLEIIAVPDDKNSGLAVYSRDAGWVEE